jgi:mRNA-degrading endonuclease RelE of RelBE toxin-antitoxin system
MSIKEKVLEDINRLDESQIKKVSDYVKFLQFQGKEKAHKSNGKKDSLFGIGKKPVDVGITNASENLDEYLY